MKCLANNKQFKSAVTKATTAMVPATTRYFTAQVIDILFTHTVGWSTERVSRFLKEFESMFISVNIHHDDQEVGCSLEDIRQILMEDYGYEPILKNTVVTAPFNSGQWRVQCNTDLCINWLASVTALLLLDKFGCSTRTVETVMERYDRRIKRYARGDRDYLGILEKIEKERGLRFRMEVT